MSILLTFYNHKQVYIFKLFKNNKNNLKGKNDQQRLIFYVSCNHTQGTKFKKSLIWQIDDFVSSGSICVLSLQLLTQNDKRFLTPKLLAFASEELPVWGQVFIDINSTWVNISATRIKTFQFRKTDTASFLLENS